MWKQLSASFFGCLALLMLFIAISSASNSGGGVQAQVVDEELVTKAQIEAVLDMTFAILEALVARSEAQQAEIEALRVQCAGGGAQ